MRAGEHRGGGIVKAVIPVAGLGTRLRPLSAAIPKEMLPVGRRPVLAYVLQELQAAGITSALFVVSGAKPQIRSYFGDRFTDGGLPPVECAYVVQEEQRGLGHAISLAQDWVRDEPFVVAFGDCIIHSLQPSPPLSRLMQLHIARQAAAATLVEAVPLERVSRYGIVKPAAGQDAGTASSLLLDDIVEKPAAEHAPSRLAVAARWVLGPGIFRYLDSAVPDARGEINLTDAVRRQTRDGAALWAERLLPGESRRDIGSFETYFDAFIRAAIADPDFGSAARRAAAEALAGVGQGG